MVTFDARVLSFPVVHPGVLERQPELSNVFQDFTVQTRKPRDKNRAFVCVEESSHPMAVTLAPSQQFLEKLNDTWVVRSKKLAQAVRIFHCFPALARWRGMTWFHYEELKELEHKGLGSLLDKNYAHPKDAAKLMKYKEKGLGLKDGTLTWQPPVSRHQHNGKPTISLRQAMERMPFNGSVRGTTSDFPYSCVPRSYLEYLVYDGGGVGEGMRTAREGLPGDNPMRDSLMVFLRKSNFIDRLLGVLPTKGAVVRDGKLDNVNRWSLVPGVVVTAHNQGIDIPTQRDLEWNPFSTFGYYQGDTFVPCGLPYKLRFQAHGVPTWIKKPEDGEEKTPGHFESLEPWKREMPWRNEEEVEPFRPFVVPATRAARVRWFWNLSRDVSLWRDRWLHHLSLEGQERSELDAVRYGWDREELRADLERHRHHAGLVLESETGLRVEKAVKRARKDLKQADVVESEQESKDKHLASCILEWMSCLVKQSHEDKLEGSTLSEREEDLLRFNLKHSRRVRSARRFRKRMTRLKGRGTGAARTDLVVELYGHKAASCWRVA